MTIATPRPELSLVPFKNALVDTDQLDLQVLARISVTNECHIPRTPLSVALVIDRSGSMEGDRLDAAKDGALQFIARLHDDDEVCVVTYDDHVSVPLQLMPVRAARTLAPALLSGIVSGNSTDLHAGWLEGAKQLAPRSGKQRLCRVILLSDGKANHGLRDIDAICDQVSQLAAAGVTTSTVGIGMGFNERLMTSIAISGQGMAMYGDHAEDLQEPFEAEIGLLTALAWRDVTMTLESASQHWKVLNPYLSPEPGIWRLPSLAVGAEVWVALSIPMARAVRAQKKNDREDLVSISVRATDANGNIQTFRAVLPALPLVSLSDYHAMPGNELVGRRFSEIEAAEIQREARRAANARNWAKVARMLDELEERGRDNPWLMQTVEVLRHLLSQRDQARLEKELMYSSHSLSSRLVASDETLSFSRREELDKAAFLRRKTHQGRRSGV